MKDSTTNTLIQRGLRTFYVLAIAQSVSQIGSNMSFLAVGIYVYQQTGQATLLALLSLFIILPRIIAGGVAGVLADRYDRRTLMIIQDTGAALGSLALVISVGSGSFQLWHVYAAALWQALFSTLQRPAFEASVSQLVPDSPRHRANAILQMSGPAALLRSSALTGLLYVAIGAVGIFLIDLMSFLVAVVTILFLRIPAPPHPNGETQAGGSMLSEWRSGINFLRSRRPLFLMIAQVTLFGFFISSVFSLMTPYVLTRTASAPTLGILTAVLSIGGVVGAVLIGVWGGFKCRIDTIAIAMILVLLATILFGTNQTPLVMGATLFMAMMGVAGANTMSMRLLQSKLLVE
jgi:MFS family permease